MNNFFDLYRKLNKDYGICLETDIDILSNALDKACRTLTITAGCPQQSKINNGFPDLKYCKKKCAGCWPEPSNQNSYKCWLEYLIKNK